MRAFYREICHTILCMHQKKRERERETTFGLGERQESLRLLGQTAWGLGEWLCTRHSLLCRDAQLRSLRFLQRLQGDSWDVDRRRVAYHEPDRERKIEIGVVFCLQRLTHNQMDPITTDPLTFEPRVCVCLCYSVSFAQYGMLRLCEHTKLPITADPLNSEIHWAVRVCVCVCIAKWVKDKSIGTTCKWISLLLSLSLSLIHTHTYTHEHIEWIYIAGGRNSTCLSPRSLMKMRSSKLNLNKSRGWQSLNQDR